MKTLSFPFIALLAAFILTARLGASEENDVLAADRTRVNALLRANGPALETILADELTYGHADGRVQSKADLLSTLAAGIVRYETYDGPPPVVRLHGDIALLNGTADLRATARGESVRFSLRYLAVYKKTGDKWRLVAYQSAPLARPTTP